MPKKSKIIEKNNKKRELNDKEENLNIINNKKIKINSNKTITDNANINCNNNKNEKTLEPISINENDFKIEKKEKILEEKNILNDLKSIDKIENEKIEIENEETIIVNESNNGNNEIDVNNKENKNVNINETMIVETEENDDNKIDNENKNEKEINKEIIIEKEKNEINKNTNKKNKNNKFYSSIEIEKNTEHYNNNNNEEDIDNSKDKEESNNDNDSYNKDNVEDKEDKLKEDNIKHNKKQQNNKIKQNVSPVRKSKRLMEKKMEVVTIDIPDTSISKKKVKIIPEIGTKNKTRAKSDSPIQKSNNSAGRRKRMNADQDLITHQNIEDTENLGKKNPLEIIKNVIGNSDEDVELIVGAQLPVLINPEINRMKYQLGEIIIIKDKNENLKDGDQSENEDNESEEEKGNKKKKRRTRKSRNKKGRVLSDNETVVSPSSNSIENNSTNENENNNTNSNINTIPNISNEINNTTNNNNYTNNNNNNTGSEKLYYIHFINQDKRLDSWRKEEDLWTKKKYPEISNDSSETTTRTTPYLFIPDDKTKLTRSMKRKYGIISESLQSLSEIDPKLAALEKEREEITKVKNIEKVQFGNYLLNSWYFSPYPNEYKNEDILYICDHCMKYMKYESTLIRHRAECPMIHPPGTLVYEKDNLRVYEIDGKKEKLYCQNFCLLSKLFLDHKTVYYDIEPFLFYVLTEKKIENGKEIDYVMGYFSKEKRSFDDYNLACILVLPPYQRKGYGHFLIEFSYELSKRENKIGSPEKPLSDLGLVGYRTYWQSVLLRIIKNNPKMNFTLRELSLLTSIRHEDIVSTLGSMNMLKYWRGEHSLCVTPKMVEEFLAEHQNIKLEPMVDANLIHDTFISESVTPKKKTNDLTN